MAANVSAMYVCICNTLTDRQVRLAIAAGAKSACDVYGHFDCSPVCGRCMAMIRSFITEADRNANDDDVLPIAAE